MEENKNNNLGQDGDVSAKKEQEEKIKKEEIREEIKEEKKKEEKAKKDFSGFMRSFRVFFTGLLDIRSNTDQETTKESIINDIPFRGHTSWILICSIFIASVGLNANSTAVVIGAMLISPLMGPILGIGMSLAINDIDTLRRSLKNFGIMVFLSILTAFLFFKFFPIREESSELLARTAPDIRDVLIAFFGGLALVIARAKKGTVATVIFGVAIATALMPPLCTVGFGLAIWNMEYTFGAMYLFTINTIFIALATFLVLKFLRFPMVKYANSKKRKRIAQAASVIAILIMIPAGYTFYNVWKESTFKDQAAKFIKENVKIYQFAEGGFLLDEFSSIDYNKGENPSIELVFMGDELIPDNVVQTWRAQMQSYSRLKEANLVIKGGGNDSEEKFQYVSELYEAKKQEIATKDQKIRVLEDEIIRLRKFAYNAVPFEEISKEVKINYEDVTELGFGNEIKTDFKTTDTVPVFIVKWKKEMANAKKQEELKKLTQWLKVRVDNEKIEVKEFTE
ncbi:DUF389 domain-containing protein [Galbibacter sp. EGI 63066]|uniref:DUF389 domain-containing protein n=1 Tax=Galbibacter sp. EGI 63066 TaxID=2993559 RepID=UPI002248CE31|nr:DUF389 domain-containing protein [Galbibacter sp. EGI 63066]MCX2679672.1 DUF389 domain-containing protein [Galbibacter sp. EGI 63066]